MQFAKSKTCPLLYLWSMHKGGNVLLLLEISKQKYICVGTKRIWLNLRND